MSRIHVIKEDFEKNILKPIENIESVESANLPQRCLQHNTILTLYCEIDRKPLCANCMYKQDTHRKHRVIPLDKAMNLVKEDINSLENKLEQNLNHCSSLSRKLQEMVIRNER